MSQLEEFKTMLKQAGNKPVFVLWSAAWCNPCRIIKPVFSKASKNSNNAIYVTVDVDKAEDISLEYKISKIPVVKVFISGEERGELGGSSETALLKFIDKYDPRPKHE